MGGHRDPSKKTVHNKKKRLRKSIDYLLRAEQPADQQVFVNRALRRKLARKGK